MSAWQDFYNNVKDANWPECESEQDFGQLPEHIQTELTKQFGYVPGEYSRVGRPSRVFPIKSLTACQLKWTWSTVYLATENTASCHRTNHHKFDTDTFDFHNTPEKLDDRARMLLSKWPKVGCEYCKNIEDAGGQSDRITNLNFPGIYSPPELDVNRSTTRVTPRMLEVYLDNTCNLKCLYCGPHFSSLWDAENKQHGRFERGDLVIPSNFEKSPNIETNKQKLFDWVRTHGHELTNFNILGGEPLFQKDLDDYLELFRQHPAPHMKLQIFTNLNTPLKHLVNVVTRIKELVDTDHIREFEITASLDCWGPEQEYVRFPLDLGAWEENFNYLLTQSWINLIINSTITPLTIKTLPDLLAKINKWNDRRRVYHYQNSVNSPTYMFIDIFGDIFREDFERALALKPTGTPEADSSREYLNGIAQQSVSRGPNIPEIKKLYDFLNEIDRRRGTNWSTTFPWLAKEFDKYFTM